MKPYLFITSNSDDDENSIAAIIGAVEKYKGSIWVTYRDRSHRINFLNLCNRTIQENGKKIQFVRDKSLLAVYIFLCAEIVMHTHGIFGSPKLFGKRIHVNLWHGNGPKSVTNSVQSQQVFADLICGNSKLWTFENAKSFGISNTVTFVDAYPRDYFIQNSRDFKKHLRPTILWLPTYRSSHFVAPVAVQEGTSVIDEDNPHIQDFKSKLRFHSKKWDVDVILKPHPLDAEDASKSGFQVISNAQIWKMGRTPYEYISNVQGILSDYSSTWVDFLGLGIPIALYCPDLAEFETLGRGKNSKISKVAPQLLLKTDGDIDSFFKEVSEGIKKGKKDQIEVMRNIQFKRNPRPLESLYLAIHEAAVAKGFFSLAERIDTASELKV